MPDFGHVFFLLNIIITNKIGTISPKLLLIENDWKNKVFKFKIIPSSSISNCNKLEKMSVPFVGDVLGESKNTNFGYFFGTSYYSNNKRFVPETLTDVYINGSGEIPATAFYNCCNIKNITFSNNKPNASCVAKCFVCNE